MRGLITTVIACVWVTGAVFAQAVNEPIKPSDFKTKMEAADVVVLDVRTDAEVAGGVIPGAKQLDFKNENFEVNLNSLDKRKTYLVYCAAGVRSAKAATIMKEKGFTKVYSLDGGIEAWTDAGFKLGKLQKK